MKKDLHPAYQTVSVRCSCGAVFEVGTTCKSNLQLDVCHHCHPFYTGKQRLVSSGGRVDKFNKRFGVTEASPV